MPSQQIIGLHQFFFPPVRKAGEMSEGEGTTLVETPVSSISEVKYSLNYDNVVLYSTVIQCVYIYYSLIFFLDL